MSVVFVTVALALTDLPGTWEILSKPVLGEGMNEWMKREKRGSSRCPHGWEQSPRQVAPSSDSSR